MPNDGIGRKDKDATAGESDAEPHAVTAAISDDTANQADAPPEEDAPAHDEQPRSLADRLDAERDEVAFAEPKPKKARRSTEPGQGEERETVAVKDGSTRDTTTVVAEGVGESADEALKDAFRNAVRQVVGAVVDAESLIKNEDVVEDKVLTYSAGCGRPRPSG